MRRSTDFSTVVRSGTRARRGAVVMHQYRNLTDGPALFGLVVGKSVGGSVRRHRVSRQLRAQLSARVTAVSAGAGIVVRALPEAAGMTSAQLGADLDRALQKLSDT